VLQSFICPYQERKIIQRLGNVNVWIRKDIYGYTQKGNVIIWIRENIGCWHNLLLKFDVILTIFRSDIVTGQLYILYNLFIETLNDKVLFPSDLIGKCRILSVCCSRISSVVNIGVRSDPMVELVDWGHLQKMRKRKQNTKTERNQVFSMNLTPQYYSIFDN